MSSIHMTLKQVNAFAFDLLTACGASDTSARSVANSIETAESDGIRNIGLG
ncbi:MAG TPA: sulfolactate dehydrogenase, partial [Desulfobacteraceae bacterium]|nr:sulfolactate dehydrogenase [Desulfobacteraceae bacterium]